MCKFSILTACYNKQRFINECVESVRCQGYDNWEHIIVDDCSTDESYEYLSSLNDKRIKVIRNKKRLYCSSTYAVALSCATGDLCGIVDGDDVLAKKAMGIMVKRYRANPEIDWIYSNFFWCNESLKGARKGFSAAPKKGKSLVHMALGKRHCYSHWRTFRTGMKDKAVLFPAGLEVSVDKNLGFTLEELGNGGFLPKCLYFYRYYRGNMSLRQGKKQKATTIELARQFQQRRQKENIRVFPIRVLQ